MTAGSRCPTNLRPHDSALITLHFRIHSLQRIFESSRFGALYLAAAIYVAISATTGLILSVLALYELLLRCQPFPEKEAGSQVL